jgi:hypothetical protein
MSALPTRGLRAWFLVHAVVDLVFALPLLAAPEWTVRMLGWPAFDPLATRLVGAALLAIGAASWLGRDAGEDGYRLMLDLKLVWAGAAVLGIVLTMASSQWPPIGWVLAALFAAFGAVWAYYRFGTRRTAPPADPELFRTTPRWMKTPPRS